MLAPVSPHDPDNGDAQYTRDLLAAPPEGVEYITYVEALRSGELIATSSLREWSAVLRRPHHAGAAAGKVILRGLRRSGVLLPDHVRWFEVSGDFDVVHDHCMPVRFLGSHPPLVLSDSAGMWWHWTHTKELPEARVARLLRRERRIARRMGYAHATVHPEPAAHTTYFVEAGHRHLRTLAPRYEATSISPVGVPGARRPRPRAGTTLLFVARDFRLKGGDDAIEIARRARKHEPRLRLVIAGSPRPGFALPHWIDWVGAVDRDTLYSDVYPQADMFLYPTRSDCAPLVVMEALAHGLPIVAPRAFALPELVIDHATGLLFEPSDIEDAVRAVSLILHDPELQAQLSKAAIADFHARFSVGRRNEILAYIYRSVAT